MKITPEIQDAFEVFATDNVSSTREEIFDLIGELTTKDKNPEYLNGYSFHIDHTTGELCVERDFCAKSGEKIKFKAILQKDDSKIEFFLGDSKEIAFNPYGPSAITVYPNGEKKEKYSVHSKLVDKEKWEDFVVLAAPYHYFFGEGAKAKEFFEIQQRLAKRLGKEEYINLQKNIYQKYYRVSKTVDKSSYKKYEGGYYKLFLGDDVVHYYRDGKVVQRIYSDGRMIYYGPDGFEVAICPEDIETLIAPQGITIPDLANFIQKNKKEGEDTRERTLLESHYEFINKYSVNNITASRFDELLAVWNGNSTTRGKNPEILYNPAARTFTVTHLLNKEPRIEVEQRISKDWVESTLLVDGYEDNIFDCALYRKNFETGEESKSYFIDGNEISEKQWIEKVSNPISFIYERNENTKISDFFNAQINLIKFYGTTRYYDIRRDFFNSIADGSAYKMTDLEVTRNSEGGYECRYDDNLLFTVNKDYSLTIPCPNSWVPTGISLNNQELKFYHDMVKPSEQKVEIKQEVKVTPNMNKDIFDRKKAVSSQLNKVQHLDKMAEKRDEILRLWKSVGHTKQELVEKPSYGKTGEWPTAVKVADVCEEMPPKSAQVEVDSKASKREETKGKKTKMDIDIKDEAREALKRGAIRKIRELFVKTIADLLSRDMEDPAAARVIAAEMLRTPYGNAILSVALGSAMPLVAAQLPEEYGGYVEEAAREFRVSGGADLIYELSGVAVNIGGALVSEVKTVMGQLKSYDDKQEHGKTRIETTTPAALPAGSTSDVGHHVVEAEALKAQLQAKK